MSVMDSVKRLERRLDVLLLPKNPAWWAWPAAMAAMGAAVLGISLVFGPGSGEHVDLWGHPWGEACGFYVHTGHPCPQCGMTRSWIWAARGHLWGSFLYNPAGAAMFWWLVLAGALGALRLITRKPNLVRVPANALLGWTLVWMVALYLLPWLGRVGLDVNPLPPPLAPIAAPA